MGFAESRKRALVEFASTSHITLLARDVAPLVERPRGSATIPECFKDQPGFFQYCPGPCIVPATSHKIGEGMQAAGDRDLVAKRTPAGQGLVKMDLRRGMV